jgi:DNA-directed RNA polymerase specialized sigma24 family protein
MANPTELDLFNRSLGGDRRARTELYKKYIFSSSQVRQLGEGYSSINDFLHDCLNNLLHTGHSWDSEDSLTHWVESVAVWTALTSERQKAMHARGAKGEIRMCAEFEGEDSLRGALMATYAPPPLSAEDSPLGRILALLPDAEKVVFQKRAIENATWEETAAAAGKSVNATGPILARGLAKIVRLFGAPPPPDDDLVPVVSRAFADPLKPEGRTISLQLDNAFYNLTPELQAIGLKTADEARAVVLWEAARLDTPPRDDLRGHLSRCRYCAAILRSFLLMQQAVLAPPGAAFRLCPGAFTLANAPDMVHEAFDQHLALCSICRDERTQVLQGNVPRTEESAAPKTMSMRKKIAWAAAAMVLLGAASAAGYHFWGPRANGARSVIADDQPVPTLMLDPRYKDLAQDVPMDNAKIMATVLPRNVQMMSFVLSQLSLNQPDVALKVSAQAAGKGDDPGAQLLYAISLFKLGPTDGYRELLKAEAMPPRNSFRCWILLQTALAVGDREVIDREAQHLAQDPEYGKRAREIIERVKSLK